MTNDDQPQSEASRAVIYIVLAIIIIVAIIVFLAYWNNREFENGLNGGIVEGNDSEELVTNILENPSAYIRQNITLGGEAEEFIGDQSFVLDTLGIVNDKILIIGQIPLAEMVINEDDEMIGIEEGDEVLVTGVVRIFTIADIEEEVGMDLEENLFVRYENLPVIVADMIINMD